MTCILLGLVTLTLASVASVTLLAGQPARDRIRHAIQRIIDRTEGRH